MQDSTLRFSDRVEDYAKFRPGYPSEILSCLEAQCGLQTTWKIADLGSGTGNLTRLFLEHGNFVYGVEPNEAMRLAGEGLLSSFKNFGSVNGRAEETGLQTHSINLVTAGQAFHWFDVAASRAEAKRILREDGWVALIWNERVNDASPFMSKYESLLLARLGDYGGGISRGHGQEKVGDFFRGQGHTQFNFDQTVNHTLDTLCGLLLSSSYAPKPGQPGHDVLFEGLKEVFEAEQVEGYVSMVYSTAVFIGQL